MRPGRIGAPSFVVRSLAPVLGVALLLASQASCGSSGPGPRAASASRPASSLDPDFISRAGAVCAPYASYSSTAYLKLARFNRYVPDPDLLPRVADHLEKNAAYRTLVPDLEDLGEPTSGADAWAAVMSDFRATAQDVRSQIRAARAAAVDEFTHVTDQLAEDTTQLHSHLGAAGLAASSCAQAESDPLRVPPGAE